MASEDAARCPRDQTPRDATAPSRDSVQIESAPPGQRAEEQTRESISSDGSPSLRASAPLAKPMPWIWICHICKACIPLGATNRCLSCSHTFCTGSTGRAHGKRKDGSCVSKFDFVAWRSMVSWKQHRAQEQDAKKEKGCHVHCNFPGECFGRWAPPEAEEAIKEGLRNGYARLAPRDPRLGVPSILEKLLNRAAEDRRQIEALMARAEKRRRRARMLEAIRHSTLLSTHEKATEQGRLPYEKPISTATPEESSQERVPEAQSEASQEQPPPRADECQNRKRLGPESPEEPPRPKRPNTSTGCLSSESNSYIPPLPKLELPPAASEPPDSAPAEQLETASSSCAASEIQPMPTEIGSHRQGVPEQEPEDDVESDVESDDGEEEAEGRRYFVREDTPFPERSDPSATPGGLVEEQQ
ncbi:hypothetical protein VTO42DRAFT_275 [Malbranchea cinnamomea]